MSQDDSKMLRPVTGPSKLAGRREDALHEWISVNRPSTCSNVERLGETAGATDWLRVRS
jgi:hypothetical protein